MPESYVGLPFMDVDTKEREKEKKVKAANDLEEFIKAIVARRKGLSEIVKGPMPGFSRVPPEPFLFAISSLTGPFMSTVNVASVVESVRKCAVRGCQDGRRRQPRVSHLDSQWRMSDLFCMLSPLSEESH